MTSKRSEPVTAACIVGDRPVFVANLLATKHRSSGCTGVGARHPEGHVIKTSARFLLQKMFNTSSLGAVNLLVLITPACDRANGNAA